jgi:hypothetical protein
MLFTRANVMKRAADHGLGYLSPAEALAWCRAEAEAEAQRINGGTSAERDTQPEVGNTLAILDPEDESEQLPSKGSASTLNPGPAKPYGQQSLVNHYSDTPYSGQLARDDTRGKKRPIDAKWLKGSYVSKRARWDGPAISTPTPLLGERPRQRHQNFPKRNGLSDRRINGPSHLSTSFVDLKSDRSQSDISPFDPDLHSSTVASGSVPSITSPRNSTYRGLSSKQNGGGLQRQQEAIDEFHYGSHESSVASTSQNRYRRNSQQRSRGVADASSLDLKPDDLIVITRPQQSSSGTLTSGLLRQNGTLSSRSNQLPKPLHNTSAAYNDLEVRNVDEEEYSFITEVAPSSRDLEMFQYRKKRRRKDSEASKPDPSVPDPVNCQMPPRMLLKSEQSDEDEHQPDDLGLIEAETGNETNITPNIIEAPASEDGKREGSHRSESSRDFMVDVTEQSSSDSVEDGTAARTLSPNQYALADPNSAIPILQAGEVVSEISSQHSNLSFRSSHSHQLHFLPNPGHNSLRPSAARTRVRISQDPNDMSTQSHNTSPLRPAEPSGSESLSEAKVDNIPCEEKSCTQIQNVMEHIQRTLSQYCPSSTSAASTQSNDQEGSQVHAQNEIRLKLIHEPPLERRSVPHSSGPNGSSQTSVEDQETSMEREVDVLPEPKVMNKPQEPKHTQCRPDQNVFHANDPEMAPETEVVPEPRITAAVIAQHSFYTIVNEQHVRISTASNDPILDATRVEISASSAFRGDGGSRDAGLSMDAQSIGDENGSPKAVDMASETSWEGRGPQSPWAAENLEPLPISCPETKVQGRLMNNLIPAINGLCKGDGSPGKNSQSEQQHWHPFERPQTPQRDVITPFDDLMNPTPAREATASHLKGGELPSTQTLVDAATNNPWSSNLRNPSLKKSGKRVSFGVLPSEEKENSQPDHSDDFDISRRRTGSPPPLQDDTDADVYDGATTTVHTFGRHFIAARQLKHALPRNLCSPLNKSPAFGAQAEAFIAADRELSTEQRRPTTSPRSPPRQLIQTSPRELVTGFGNIMASFDMEDALGDVSDFLEDWSVDAELKRARESGSSSQRESNGDSRRKLSGIV